MSTFREDGREGWADDDGRPSSLMRMSAFTKDMKSMVTTDEPEDALQESWRGKDVPQLSLPLHLKVDPGMTGLEMLHSAVRQTSGEDVGTPRGSPRRGSAGDSAATWLVSSRKRNVRMSQGSSHQSLPPLEVSMRQATLPSVPPTPAESAVSGRDPRLPPKAVDVRLLLKEDDLERAGVPLKTLDRIYRMVEFYCVGFQNLVDELLSTSARPENLVSKIWTIFVEQAEVMFQGQFASDLTASLRDMERKHASMVGSIQATGVQADRESANYSLMEVMVREAREELLAEVSIRRRVEQVAGARERELLALQDTLRSKDEKLELAERETAELSILPMRLSEQAKRMSAMTKTLDALQERMRQTEHDEARLVYELRTTTEQLQEERMGSEELAAEAKKLRKDTRLLRDMEDMLKKDLEYLKRDMQLRQNDYESAKQRAEAAEGQMGELEDKYKVAREEASYLKDKSNRLAKEKLELAEACQVMTKRAKDAEEKARMGQYLIAQAEGKEQATRAELNEKSAAWSEDRARLELEGTDARTTLDEARELLASTVAEKLELEGELEGIKSRNSKIEGLASTFKDRERKIREESQQEVNSLKSQLRGIHKQGNDQRDAWEKDKAAAINNMHDIVANREAKIAALEEAAGAAGAKHAAAVEKIEQDHVRALRRKDDVIKSLQDEVVEHKGAEALALDAAKSAKAELARAKTHLATAREENDLLAQSMQMKEAEWEVNRRGMLDEIARKDACIKEGEDSAERLQKEVLAADAAGAKKALEDLHVEIEGRELSWAREVGELLTLYESAYGACMEAEEATISLMVEMDDEFDGHGLDMPSSLLYTAETLRPCFGPEGEGKDAIDFDRSKPMRLKKSMEGKTGGKSKQEAALEAQLAQEREQLAESLRQRHMLERQENDLAEALERTRARVALSERRAREMAEAMRDNIFAAEKRSLEDIWGYRNEVSQAAARKALDEVTRAFTREAGLWDQTRALREKLAKWHGHVDRPTTPGNPSMEEVESSLKAAEAELTSHEETERMHLVDMGAKIKLAARAARSGHVSIKSTMPADVEARARVEHEHREAEAAMLEARGKFAKLLAAIDNDVAEDESLIAVASGVEEMRAAEVRASENLRKARAALEFARGLGSESDVAAAEAALDQIRSAANSVHRTAAGVFHRAAGLVGLNATLEDADFDAIVRGSEGQGVRDCWEAEAVGECGGGGGGEGEGGISIDFEEAVERELAALEKISMGKLDATKRVEPEDLWKMCQESAMITEEELRAKEVDLEMEKYDAVEMHRSMQRAAQRKLRELKFKMRQIEIRGGLPEAIQAREAAEVALVEAEQRHVRVMAEAEAEAEGSAAMAAAAEEATESLHWREVECSAARAAHEACKKECHFKAAPVYDEIASVQSHSRQIEEDRARSDEALMVRERALEGDIALAEEVTSRAAQKVLQYQSEDVARSKEALEEAEKAKRELALLERQAEAKRRDIDKRLEEERELQRLTAQQEKMLREEEEARLSKVPGEVDPLRKRVSLTNRAAPSTDVAGDDTIFDVVLGKHVTRMTLAKSLGRKLKSKVREAEAARQGLSKGEGSEQGGSKTKGLLGRLAAPPPEDPWEGRRPWEMSEAEPGVFRLPIPKGAGTWRITRRGELLVHRPQAFHGIVIPGDLPRPWWGSPEALDACMEGSKGGGDGQRWDFEVAPKEEVPLPEPEREWHWESAAGPPYSMREQGPGRLVLLPQPPPGYTARTSEGGARRARGGGRGGGGGGGGAAAAAAADAGWSPAPWGDGEDVVAGSAARLLTPAGIDSWNDPTAIRATGSPAPTQKRAPRPRLAEEPSAASSGGAGGLGGSGGEPSFVARERERRGRRRYVADGQNPADLLFGGGSSGTIGYNPYTLSHLGKWAYSSGALDWVLAHMDDRIELDRHLVDLNSELDGRDDGVRWHERHYPARLWEIMEESKRRRQVRGENRGAAGVAPGDPDLRPVEPPVMRQDEYGPHWLAVGFGGDAAGEERGATPLTVPRR